tara:strand:+ start:159 stop:473 length:315 start_codon:yes stop_codon:yes gene_type:complete
MKKLNELKESQFEELFDYIKEDLGSFIIDTESEHRKGNTFFNESIVKIDNCFDKVDEKFHGLWKTNNYLSSSLENGFDSVDTLTRVEKHTKIVTKEVIEYLKVG